MSVFRFIPLGVGDAFSTRWYSSCLALNVADAWLLVDCPHPIRKIMKEAGDTAGLPLDINQFAGIVLTHLHADHASGLEDYAFYCKFVMKRRAVVLTHPEVAADLWDGHSRSGMGHFLPEVGKPLVKTRPEDYFDIYHLAENRAVRFGPFEIECRRTIHHIPTFALRICAGGRCLGYSADTAYDPHLIQWLTQADTIVHETNRGTHTPYEKLAALPESLRGKLRLIHYADDFELEQSAIEPLRQGRVYVV